MNAPRSKKIVGTIIKTGLLAGTLDISIALVRYNLETGKDPSNVLRFIASGIFGKAAFTGGNTMAAYGLLFHFVIAFIWTIIFFLAYPKIPFFKKNIIVTALVYGLFVWLIMSRIVLPLSAAPTRPFDIKQAFIAMLILVIAIGLPLSFFAKRYYSSANAR